MIYTGPLGQHSSHVIQYIEVSVLHKKMSQFSFYDFFNVLTNN